MVLQSPEDPALPKAVQTLSATLNTESHNIGALIIIRIGFLGANYTIIIKRSPGRIA